MTLMRFLCSLFPGRCEPSTPEQSSATADQKKADLGQKEAKDEALSEEQLRHMEGAKAAKAASKKKGESRKA
jgi:hypothetical protein